MGGVSRAARRVLRGGEELVRGTVGAVGDVVTGGALSQKEAAKKAEDQAKKQYEEEQARLAQEKAQKEAIEKFNREVGGLQTQLAQEQATTGAVGALDPATFARTFSDGLKPTQTPEEEDKLKKALRR